MALETHQVPSPCVTWKTALPLPSASCSSPFFVLKEADAKLVISTSVSSGGNTTYGVCLETTRSLGTEFAYVAISVMRQNGEYCRLLYGQVYFNTQPQSTSCYRTSIGGISKSQIGILLDNVSLAFVFHFIDSFSPKDTTPSTSSKAIQPEKLSIHPCLLSLSEDIGKLFDNEEHSDVVLKCGDRSFFVNRKILSARSEVFAAMFRNKMSENETGLVDITDMEADILEQFLRYVYSGRLDSLSMDSVYDLYRAGDKYAIPSLKRKCASLMVDNLSEENVCEILPLADTFADTELLDSATTFAVNRDGFLGSDKWVSFTESHPAVALKVFVKFHAKKPIS